MSSCGCGRKEIRRCQGGCGCNRSNGDGNESSGRSAGVGGGINDHDFFIIRRERIVWITSPETEDFQCIPTKIRDRDRGVAIRSPEEGAKNGAGSLGSNIKSGK